jgi:hypothetical protein
MAVGRIASERPDEQKGAPVASEAPIGRGGRERDLRPGRTYCIFASKSAGRARVGSGSFLGGAGSRCLDLADAAVWTS